MRRITHKDFNTEPIDNSEWNICDLTTEGDKLEFETDNTPRKYVFKNGKLYDYYWNGVEWIFIKVFNPKLRVSMNDRKPKPVLWNGKEFPSGQHLNRFLEVSYSAANRSIMQGTKLKGHYVKYKEDEKG